MSGVSKALGSFAAGAIMTIVLVVIIPVMIDSHITPTITDLVGDSSFLQLSASFLVSALVWLVMIGFMIVLGAGTIMKKFGVFGILGLIVAYYILGDVSDAAVPILSLIAVSLVIWIYRSKKKGSSSSPKNGREIFD